MERMKKILLKVLSVTSPLLILALLGVMQGAWFDAEKYVGMEDADLHHPTATQYTLYYLVSAVLFALSWLLLNHQYKKSSALSGRVLYGFLLAVDITIILICATAL